MEIPMNGRTIIEQLHRLCRDIDAGKPLRPLTWKRALAPAILGLSLAASGGCSNATPEPVEPSNPPQVEDCTDGVDNDGDGSADCGDTDCLEHAACQAVTEYGAPMPQDEQPPQQEPPLQQEPTPSMYAAPFL